jgi:ubiquinone/menaquinone biosynthesis C-methylase UbiE
MKLRPGSQIADVGCGSGEIALVWSRAVGPSGHVYAEDIDKRWALPRARKLMKKHNARNVTLIQGEPANPKLPEGVLDAVFLLDVYHELEQQTAMLAHFRRALKPDGRLVIIDPLPRKTGTRGRNIQMTNHVLSPDLAEKELKEAGFGIVLRDDRFLDHPDSESVQWILVASPSPGTQKQQ